MKWLSSAGIVFFIAFFSFQLCYQVNATAQSNSGSGKTISLSAADLIKLKAIALEKADYFYYLLNRIASKSTPKDSADFYMNEANKLFVNNALIEVKSKGGKSVNRPVKDYLKKLSDLPYTETKIEKFSAFFISELQHVRTIVDKNNITIEEWEGVILCEQYFEGRIEGRIVYADTTLKSIRAVVQYKEQKGLGTQSDVLLGDIHVLAVK